MSLTSNRIVVADAWAGIEYCYRENLTDGLPVVPPTEELVQSFLDAAALSADSIIAELTERARVITAEKLAINAVMAGCLPEYMPVLVAAVEALADPAFNLQGVQVTTNPVAPLLIVNGPARQTLGFNAGYGCFGPGHRANATVGRAVRLILINIGSAIPGEGDMAVAGHPGKYTFCVAEHKEESPWEPLHVERGLPRESSAVTLIGISGFMNTLQATVE